MTNNPINFKQERDFGDLFNATFSFISHEFKRLALAVLYFVVPVLLLASIALTVYSIKSQEMMQALAQSHTEKPNLLAIFSGIASLWGYIAFAMIIGLIAYTLLLGTVYGYIKLYIQNGPEGFTMNDVWKQITTHFLGIMAATFITGLVIGVGFIFCVIPGIYLGVALSVVICIMVFEEVDFSTAFGRSIKLINKNWWQTFAVIIIATIILYILTIFISLPSLLFGFKSFFKNIKNGQPLTSDLSIGYYIANTITQLLTHILMVVPTVISAFIYYSAVEKVEKPSLIEKIGQINDHE
jgi:hypothetical protein